MLRRKPKLTARHTGPDTMHRGMKTDLERLRAAHATVAQLVLADPVYAPVFERLDRELAQAEAALSGDILTRARAIVAAQSAMA